MEFCRNLLKIEEEKVKTLIRRRYTHSQTGDIYLLIYFLLLSKNKDNFLIVKGIKCRWAFPFRIVFLFQSKKIKSFDLLRQLKGPWINKLQWINNMCDKKIRSKN